MVKNLVFVSRPFRNVFTPDSLTEKRIGKRHAIAHTRSQRRLPTSSSALDPRSCNRRNRSWSTTRDKDLLLKLGTHDALDLRFISGLQEGPSCLYMDVDNDNDVCGILNSCCLCNSNQYTLPVSGTNLWGWVEWTRSRGARATFSR